MIAKSPTPIALGPATTLTGDPDQLLDESDAGRFLRVAPRTLQNWRHSSSRGLARNRLPIRGPRFIYVNGRVRYRLADLRAFVAAKQSPLTQRGRNSR